MIHDVVPEHKIWESVRLPCTNHPHDVEAVSSRHTKVGNAGWQDGQAHAFDYLEGVPRMLVPDNCATAADRSAIYVTLVNREYERFAEHYGAAVVPSRVRKPRD